jgi:hypothetical protein
MFLRRWGSCILITGRVTIYISIDRSTRPPLTTYYDSASGGASLSTILVSAFETSAWRINGVGQRATGLVYRAIFFLNT